jgi:hypothetical protein
MSTFKVKYKGLSDERHITVENLAELGITVSEDLSWVRKTILDPAVFVDSPSEDLLTILKADGNFDVEEVDAKGLPTGVTLVTHDPAKADDTGATLKDGVTGEVHPPAPAASKK